MSREIKFRAKRIDNGDWVYGYYTEWDHFNGKGYERVHAIEAANRAPIPIDKQTLGQYTGLQDKHFNDIYEGDIIRAKRKVTGMPLPNGKCAEVFSGSPDKVTREWYDYLVVEIKAENGLFGFQIPLEAPTYQERGKPLEWEVIGNIYEHNHLIEKQ